MEEETKDQIGQALSKIPGTLFVLTSHHEERHDGVLISFIQQVSFDPPMVVVSLNKGREIIPLIHDSHAFGLCQVKDGDRLIMSKFSRKVEFEADRFEGLDFFKDKTGSPILKRCVSYMDCTLVRHLDVDADHDIYIGRVRSAGFPMEGDPIIHTRKDGFRY